ncbi:amidohydrolase [Pseudoxanthomonas sp. PXM02]|nr:amidohydrolase [Pseudoxanthomonas sp. PXM02]MBD9477383.1 amidohydrolase [Pseudoxanthomonas sp. PXM02]
MLLLALSCCASTRAAEVSVGADLIVYNARIHTGSKTQPEASAVAVKAGRIYSVGRDADILSLKGDQTQLIDAGQKRLIPGINDAHTHILNERGYNLVVRWDGVPTLKRALAMLSEQAKRTPEGHWVKVIGGWSPYQFKENRFPTLDELRKAVPNRPLIVQYAYNRAFMNELAMTAFGVGTKKFPALPGTEFEKDAQGNYTGVVHGYTFTFISLESMVPQPSFEEQVSSITNAIHDVNRFGVTSIVDAAPLVGYPAGHAPVQALIKENRLNVRFPFIDLQFGDESSASLVDAQINAVTRKAPISAGQNLHPTMAHGHEYEGAGELLRMEVHDHENFDRPAYIIDPVLMRGKMEEDIAKLVQHGIPFRMHVSYDENISPFLDAVESVNRKTPLDGLRWSIEHAETISPENIARVKKLGGGIALDTKMASHGDGFIKTYGMEKAWYTPRLRELVDSGVPLAMTTDAFRASTFNPWIGISWMTTGKSVSGSQILADDNRLTRAEALALFTVGPAWFVQQENEMGKIAPGHLADFALLDKDYFTVSDDQIKTISSVLTVVDGRVVFGAQAYADLSPVLPPTLPEWSPVKYFGDQHPK